MCIDNRGPVVDGGSCHFVTGSEVHVIQWLAGEPITKIVGVIRSPLDVLLDAKNQLSKVVPLALRLRRMTTDEVVQLRNKERSVQ